MIIYICLFQENICMYLFQYNILIGLIYHDILIGLFQYNIYICYFIIILKNICLFQYNIYFCLFQYNLTVLRDRLFHALNVLPQGVTAPACPWQKVNVVAPGSASVPQQQHRQQTYQPTVNSTYNSGTTGENCY